MCVRYSLHQPEVALLAIAESLGVSVETGPWAEPRYNIAPSQSAPVMALVKGAPQLWPMQWGMIPPADRRSPAARPMTNARLETLHEKPSFRDAAARRRCVVAANGFYEFVDAGRRKDAYLFTSADGAPLALAGIWAPPFERESATFAVVTTVPNGDVAPFHHRMPAILSRETLRLWLGDRPLPAPTIGAVAAAAAEWRLAARRVNAFVNDARHEGPKCLAEPDPEDGRAEMQLGLGFPG